MVQQSQSGYTRITVALEPPAARVTLNHPPLNVIDVTMMDELRAALEQIETRPEISAIVFGGSERAFSSGVDVEAHTPDKVREMLTAFHSVIRSVVSNNKLTIASVRRHCLGGGAELALMCDVVYASPDSVWGFPGDQAGVLCAGRKRGSVRHCGTEAGGGVAADRPNADWTRSARCGACERHCRRSRDPGHGMSRAGWATESDSAYAGEEGVLCMGFNPFR